MCRLAFSILLCTVCALIAGGVLTAIQVSIDAYQYRLEEAEVDGNTILRNVFILNIIILILVFCSEEFITWISEKER